MEEKKNEFYDMFGLNAMSYSVLNTIRSEPVAVHADREMRCRYPACCAPIIEGRAVRITLPRGEAFWHPECYDNDSMTSGMISLIRDYAKQVVARMSVSEMMFIRIPHEIGKPEIVDIEYRR